MEVRRHAPILPVQRHDPRSKAVHFYELHEGDNEVYGDALLAHEEEYEPDEFFELVQQIRRRVQDTFEDDTLIEAIAIELERDHGFVFITDDRLTAAVNVSRDDEENFLARIDPGDEEEDEGEEEDEDADYLTITADFEPGSRPN
jgi:hypothetical protein